MKMWNQIVIQFLSARSDAYRAVTHLPGCWMLCSWCVLWQSSESAGSPVTPREAWMSISGPFARLPAPPHITADVSLSVSLTLNWFLQTASFTQSAVCIHTYSLYLYCIHTLMWLMAGVQRWRDMQTKQIRIELQFAKCNLNIIKNVVTKRLIFVTLRISYNDIMLIKILFLVLDRHLVC